MYNIISTPCVVLEPCQNQGTCINNKTSLNGYICYCSSGFNGSECQFDNRPCKTNTCWNISDTEFICICPDGWTNIHCETKVNYCQNITCENNGVCLSLFQNYQCQCSSSDYSGRHCELTASALVTRKIVSKSFGYVAIICIVVVVGFFVILDILIHVILNENEYNVEELDRRRNKNNSLMFQYASSM